MSVQHGIVLGCSRSGTTYLMSVLNTIPDFECLSGTLLPVAIPHVVNQDLDPDVYDALAIGFERAVDSYLHSGRYHSRAAALQKWYQTRSGFGDLLKALRGHRDLPDLFVYKEPAFSFAPEFVLRTLPTAKIIHLVRDGRDVANSAVNSYDILTDDNLTRRQGLTCLGRKYDHRYVPWWVEEGEDKAFIKSSPYVRAIWMWKYMVQRCHDVFSQPEIAESGQVLLVSYEEFMNAPTKIAPKILDHLGAEPTTAFWRRLEEAHTRSIGKYKRRSPEEIRHAEDIAGEALKAYGYELYTRDQESLHVQ